MSATCVWTNNILLLYNSYVVVSKNKKFDYIQYAHEVLLLTSIMTNVNVTNIKTTSHLATVNMK